MAARLFRGRRELHNLGAEHWQIHPVEKVAIRSAVYLDGMLERIRKVNEFSTMENELRHMRDFEVEHSAITAYRLVDAHLIDGQIYASDVRIPLREGRPPLLPRHPSAHLKRGTLASTWAGQKWFGHWLFDDCPLGILCTEMGDPVSIDRMEWSHVPRYREVFDRKIPLTESCRFDELTVVVDRGQNSNKRGRYLRMREAVRVLPGRRQNHGVYMLRGTSGERRVLANEPEIAEACAKAGFEVIDPMRLSVDEICAATKDASVVVSVEGSHILHAYLNMSPAGAVIGLISPDRFATGIKDYLDCLGIPYGCIIGNPSAGGFTVDTDEIFRTIDLVGRVKRERAML